MRLNKFDMGNERRIQRICYRLLLQLGEQERFNIFEEAVKNSESLTTLTQEISYLLKEHQQRETDPQLRSKAPVVLEHHAQELKKGLLEKIKSAADTDKLLSVPQMLEVLNFWREHTDGKDARDFCGRIASSPTDFPKFLEHFLSPLIQTRADGVQKTGYRLHPKWPEAYLGSSQAVNRARELKSRISVDIEKNGQTSIATPRQIVAIDQILKEAETIDNGKDPDDPATWRDAL